MCWKINKTIETMKKTILLLIFLPTLCFSQTPEIKGFMGLKLGMSKEEAFATLLQRKTETPILLDTINSSYVVQNVEFFETKFDLYLEFYNNKLYSGLFSINGKNLTEASNLFNDFKNKYNQKYGTQDVSTDMARWVDKINSSMILIAYRLKNGSYYFQIVYADNTLTKEKEKSQLKDL